ncbi:hypothetical protein TSUD_36040 [Trifolium subterraneum]|uniref:Uncharacterized protein n=1 Tax=Trifolium subterraneum TaxID=3900 RepID=A0A2Z6PBK3_TRISU|nr:hypothetical protein TSUD_36040 [Trifolium subterraneum]
MALVVEWYDFVCFGIVGVSILVSLWVLWTNEGSSASHSDFDILVDSLLVSSPSQDNRVATGYLGTTVSAYRCWKLFNKPPPLQNGEMAEFLRRDLDTKSSIRLQSPYVEEEFKQIAGFLGYLMQITYQTSAGAVILTDIVFWCVIVPFLSISRFKLNMLMGCMHTLNAFFLLLDTLLNNLVKLHILCFGAARTLFSNGLFMPAVSNGGRTHFSSLISHMLPYGISAWRWYTYRAMACIH